jgi:hypothetical protein
MTHANETHAGSSYRLLRQNAGRLPSGLSTVSVRLSSF